MPESHHARMRPAIAIRQKMREVSTVYRAMGQVTGKGHARGQAEYFGDVGKSERTVRNLAIIHLQDVRLSPA